VKVEVIPLRGLPEISTEDDLPGLLLAAIRRERLTLADGDVVAVTQKVVSKAEGRVVAEGPDGKEAWVQKESRRVVASRGDVVITETRHGFVCANAGVDASNVAEGFLTLLPEDPDGSAERIRSSLVAASGAEVGVVVTDTFGRAWRTGVVNVAIGCAGLPSVVDLRGTKDGLGRTLEVTIVALADEVAAAAGLAMGKAEGVPAALVRGVRAEAPPAPASALVRPAREDLFRTSPLQAIRDRRELASFDERAVPRSLVEEAVGAVLGGPALLPGLSVLLATVESAQARRRLLRASDPDARAVLGAAPVVILPFVHVHPTVAETPSRRDGWVAAGGAAVQSLLLALSSQGLASTWIPPERFDASLLRELGGGDDTVPVGAVTAGWPAGGA